MEIDRPLPSKINPQIYSYLKKFQEDPTSRVFAPLAEAYRKSGLVDEAISIAREGLRYHPNLISGRVTLAKALFDQLKFEDVLHEMKPVVLEAPDNLVAQKLLAESALMLGRIGEALTAYKMLLFFNPGDVETAQLVHEMESKGYENGDVLLKQDPEAEEAEEFSILSTHQVMEPDAKAVWMKKIEKLQSLLVAVGSLRSLR